MSEKASQIVGKLRSLVRLLPVILPALFLAAKCDFTVTPTDSLGDAEQEGIIIDSKDYENGFEAVWFSPADGETKPVHDSAAATPPEIKYYFRIEPGFPRFQAVQRLNTDSNGILRLGSDSAVFNADYPLTVGEYSRDLFAASPDSQRQFKIDEVYLIRVPGGGCVIQILEWRQAEHFLRFKWRSWQGDSARDYFIFTLTPATDSLPMFWFSSTTGDTLPGDTSRPSADYDFRIDPRELEFSAPAYKNSNEAFGIKMIGQGDKTFNQADSLTRGGYSESILIEHFQPGFVFMISAPDGSGAVIELTEIDYTLPRISFKWKRLEVFTSQ